MKILYFFLVSCIFLLNFLFNFHVPLAIYQCFLFAASALSFEEPFRPLPAKRSSQNVMKLLTISRFLFFVNKSQLRLFRSVVSIVFRKQIDSAFAKTIVNGHFSIILPPKMVTFSHFSSLKFNKIMKILLPN